MSGAGSISVVMITRDVAELLPGALRSLPEGVEIIVADCDSRDGTTELARSFGARVVRQAVDVIRQADGVFDVARNAAAEHAGGEWLLHLDADERLSPELARELVVTVQDDPVHAAYEMPRSNLFWGRPVRLLGPDYQRRLVRRGRGFYSAAGLHRKMEVQGTTGRLDSKLIHLNVRNWADVARRFRQYLPIEARTLGRRPTTREILLSPFHLFRYYYFENGAIRDGVRGLVVSAIYAAYGGAVLSAARRRANAGS